MNAKRTKIVKAIQSIQELAVEVNALEISKDAVQFNTAVAFMDVIEDTPFRTEFIYPYIHHVCDLEGVRYSYLS